MTLQNRLQALTGSASGVDELTGLYNREGFLKRVDELVKRAFEAKKELVLVFADIDGLHKINEHMGHREGDVALIRTADLLKGTFRKSDVVGCMGGDDFVVSALQSRSDGVDILTSRLQESVERFNAQNEGSYKLSLSLGAVSLSPENASSPEELLKKTEELLPLQRPE